MSKPSYHDLAITTRFIPRTLIMNLPLNVWVRCTRTTGWEVWQGSGLDGDPAVLVAGEFQSGDKALRLDVDGFVICNHPDVPEHW